MINNSDFFKLGLTRIGISAKGDSVKGTFTMDGKDKVFIVNKENHMDKLYNLLIRSIRKDKLEKLNG